MAPVCCNHCSDLFYSKSQYKKHKRSTNHPGKFRYICAQCADTFRSCEEWSLHCRTTRHAGRLSDAPAAGTTLSSNGKRSDSQQPRTVPAEPHCDTCDRSFYTFHELAKHPCMPRRKESKVAQACTGCANPPALGEVHPCTPSARATCSTCGQKFGRLAELAEHLAQNPLSCQSCTVHLPLGTSLEDHWRLSEQHPFCDKCEKGFQDSRTFAQHAMVCSLAVQIQAQDASNAEVPSGLSEEDDRSQGSDSLSVLEPGFGPSLLFSRREEAPRSYHDEDTPSVAHSGSQRDPQDTSLAKTQREQVYQQRCLERILDLLKRKPIERPQGQDEDTTGSQASHTPTNRSDTTDASLGDDLPSMYRASGSGDAVSQEEEDIHSHVQRPMLGERRERRKLAPEEDDSDRTVDAQNAFEPLQAVGGARVAQSAERTSGPPLLSQAAGPQQAHSPKDGLPKCGVVPLSPRFRALARPAMPGPVRGQMAPPVRQTKNSTQLLCGACLLRPCADPVLTRCGHIFCKGCILEKLRDELKCPTCRETYFTVLEP